MLENLSKAVQHELFIRFWRTSARLCNTSCLSCAGEPQQGYATCNTSCISGVGELQQSCATRAVYPVLENLSKAVQHELFIRFWRTSARLSNTSCLSCAGEPQQGCAICNTSCISGVGKLQQGCATRAVYLVLENLSKAVQHATRAVYLVLENLSKAVQHELFIWCWRTSARPTRTPHACCE